MIVVWVAWQKSAVVLKRPIQGKGVSLERSTKRFFLSVISFFS